MLEHTKDPSADDWEHFLGAENEEDYFLGWLRLQCRLVPVALQAVLVVRRNDGPFTPLASWPAQGAHPARLAEVLERVIEERCGLVLKLQDGGHGFGIAYPLLLDGQLTAVVAMEVQTQEETALRGAMEHLQWGIAWLEVLWRRQRASEDAATLSRLQAAVDLLAVALGEDHFQLAALAFVTELAAITKCDRVSLGLLRGRHIRLEAISNSAEVSEKMNLTGAIALAMDEAVLQRREMVYPAPEDAEILINREHEHLSRLQNQAAIATLPLFQQGRFYGALTCERPADQPFSGQDITFIRTVTMLVSPALEAKEHNDQPLWRTISDATRAQIAHLVGPGYVGRKALLVLLTIVAVFFGLATGEYRLAADTTLEGAVRRAVVAPFDGYIEQAPARAGDLVAKEAVLCTLDDRDLRLERLSRVSQRSQLQRQHQNAVAKYDRAQAIIIEAQIDQATAELELIEAKLQRTRLLAPFAGLLISGDLSQRLGSAVSKGDVLFEVTPLDAYRVILEVDERRIGDVRTGQQGNLVLSSQPGKTYAFTISKITPITSAEDGRNFFRVEAQLATVDDSLRPGMEGVGKVFVDRRRLISIWTRELIEWLRLWLWRWLP